MKRFSGYQIALLIIGLTFFRDGFSQVYTFSKDTVTYTDLSGATNLSGSTYWDDEYWVIPIGFDFLGEDTLTVSSNGLVSLVDYNNLADQQVTYSISAFGDASIGADLLARDIANPANSPVSYLLSGTSPNQILKIEWKNAGFYWDSSAAKKDYISFQLWLYEDSNNVEMYYGPHYFYNRIQYMANNSFGPVIGIGSYKYDLSLGTHYNEYVNSAPSIYLSGNAKTPVAGNSFSTLTATDTSSCAPVRNSRFRFTRDLTVTGIGRKTGLVANIYPNPVSGPLHIEFVNRSGARITLCDTSGKQVYEENVAASNAQFSGLINTGSLPEGLYLLRIESDSSVFSQLISIQ